MHNVDLRIPPHSTQAEQAILGAVLLRNDILNKIIEQLNQDDFYQDSHRRIYYAMCVMYGENSEIDSLTLGERLQKQGDLEKVGGAIKISNLTDSVATVQNIEHYIKIVKDNANIRRVIYAAQEIVANGFKQMVDADEYCDAAEKAIFVAANKKSESSYVHIGEPLKKAFNEFEEASKKPGGLSGLTSGFPSLDKKTGGFQNSDLIILAGRPSMGKTAIATNIMINAVTKTKLPVLFFSLEMSQGQIVRRILAAESMIEASLLRANNISGENWSKIIETSNSLLKLPIYIDDTSPTNPMKIRSRSRRLKSEVGLSMIVIDYLQLMYPDVRNRRSREQEISEISRSLKLLAKELDVPVIALSQLNRGLEARPNKRPIMADLRESGAIEQDADLILFVYRDEVYNTETEDFGIAEIIISKHRSGPIGTIRTRFFPEFTRFENLAEENNY